MEGNMGNTKLTGWLLVIGPIGTVIVWLGLSSLLVGNPATDTAAASLQNNLDNETGWAITGFLGALVTIAMVCGFTLFSKSMIGEGNPFATLAALQWPTIFAVIAASIGLSIGAVDHAKETSIAAATFLEVTSNNVGGLMPLLWGLGLLLVGLAIITTKAAASFFGIILTAAGLVQISTIFYDDGPLGNIIWILSTIVMAVIGISMLTKGKES